MDEQTTAQGQMAVPETTEQAPAGFAEAPYSGNVRVRYGGYDWQFTIRDNDKERFKKKVRGFNTWLKAEQAEKGNGQHDQQATHTQPAAPQAVTPAAPSVPSAPAGQPQTAATAQVFTMIVETMEITPRADGKVDAKFYQAGHQYPDIYATKTPDVLCQILAATGQWTPAHFAVANKHTVKMAIEWVNSDKLNKNGKPYKNIVAIKAAH